MKILKSFLFVVIVILSLSCNPILYPMPGMNYDNISNIKSAEPLDSAWSIINRILVSNGFVIKEADKMTGTITTDKYDFSKRFSFVKDGKPIDSIAWVALSYVTNKGGFGHSTFHVYAHWTVQIKASGAGSLIRIDMSKVDASAVKPAKSTFHPDQTYSFNGQSTGVFEKILADAVR